MSNHTLRRKLAALTATAALVGASPSFATFVDFTGGTVILNDGSTETTNGAATFQNVAAFEDQGFRMEFTFDGTPTPFASIVGDYYNTGNDVIHLHWSDGPFGEVTELRISRIDGATFDLGGFRVSTNTANGGGFSDGSEAPVINSNKGSNLFAVTPDNWGLGSGPDPLITIDPANTLLNDISWFSFTNPSTSGAVGLGLDNFFLDEPGDPNGSDPTLPTTSVPEPGSLALLGLGALALLRRKNHRR